MDTLLNIMHYKFVIAATQRNRLIKKWKKAFDNSHNPNRTLRGFNYWAKIEIDLSAKIRYWQDIMEKYRE